MPASDAAQLAIRLVAVVMLRKVATRRRKLECFRVDQLPPLPVLLLLLLVNAMVNKVGILDASSIALLSLVRELVPSLLRFVGLWQRVGLRARDAQLAETRAPRCSDKGGQLTTVDLDTFLPLVESDHRPYGPLCVDLSRGGSPKSSEWGTSSQFDEPQQKHSDYYYTCTVL